MLHGDPGRDRREPGILVSVSDLDIACGTPGIGQACAVARSIHRAMRGAHVVVNVDVVLINQRRWWLPKEARQFIEDYDRGVKVEPLSFMIMPADARMEVSCV